MNYNFPHIRYFLFSLVTLIMITLTAPTTASGEYDALDGVKRIKAVFDVSLESPQAANVVFGAVKNVYEDQNVRSLPEQPQVAVVFHGPAVKLISTNHEGFDDADKAALSEFANMVRQMKNDGVKLEVCSYALEVLGVDPATVLPEVEKVGNGFISVVGYQSQGYSVVTIN
jgi:uncharacterized protein